jgi:RNA polymerase sigma-70 factor (ECF subfamily)
MFGARPGTPVHVAELPPICDPTMSASAPAGLVGWPARARHPDHDLVARLRRGEDAAVGVAYDRHHAAVRRFARRLVGDDAAAEDLVHEAFVTLPRAIRHFGGESSLCTFLISIAVNHARHHLRAAARRRAALERLAREPAAGGPDPEQHAERASIARALNRALDTLPHDQRVVFVLCDVEERTAGEVSEITGAPEATVRTRLFHARRKLRAELERQGVR